MNDVKHSVSARNYDRRAITLATVVGKLKQVKLLYQCGALGDGSDSCILAAANGQLPVVKYLLGAGCDITESTPKILSAAAANGRLDIVKYLYRRKYSLRADGDAAIIAAAAKGHVAVVKYLHKEGANIQGCESVVRQLPLLPSHRDALEYLAANGVFMDGPKLADLIQAIRNRNLTEIQVKCKDLDVAHQSSVLLRIAAESDDPELMQLLAEHGCDIHIEDEIALRIAAEKGHVHLLRHLQHNGANIHVLDEEPLKSAAVNGHLEVVANLLDCGADLSRIDADTAAIMQLNGHIGVFNFLTERGFDAIPEARPIISAMRSELYKAAPVYHPSKLWEFFNEKNMAQLRRDGITRFKRSINQNYFNFVPQSVADPQLLKLSTSWMRNPTLSPLKITLLDPDLIRNDHELVPSDRRIFKFDNRLRILPRALQNLQAKFGRSIQLTYYRFLVAMLWDFATANDKLGLANRLVEPRVGSPIEAYFRGRIISQDLAHSIIECNSILNDVDKLEHGSRLHVAEVGAGYGRLGYVLLHALDCQYAVFDIPPSLYVSQWYLGELFPKKRIFRFRHFDRFEEIADELSQADIAFFSANQIELIPEGYFDIGINISSLHELRPDQINNLLQQIYRISRSFVYLKQYKEYLNPHDGLRILEDAYKVPREWKHKYYRDDAVDARFFETLIENAAPLPPRGVTRGSSLRQAAGIPEHDVGAITVSILLANYNHAQYLPTALAGICGQTHPATEIIIVDDGSTDDSVSVIEGFAARFQSIRLLKNGRNRGQHYSIQRALVAARGEYVVWASADDLLLPDFLERSLGALRKHPEAGLCFSQLAVFVDGTTERKDFTGKTNGAAFEYRGFGGYLSAEQLVATLRKHYVWISGNTIVARRAALLEIGGFEHSLRWHADWFAYYAVALRYGACVIPETLALMRERRETYSGKGIADPVEQHQVLTAILDTIKSPRFYDLLPAFRTCPSLLSPFGGQTLCVALENSRHWDLVWPLTYSYAARFLRYPRRYAGVTVRTVRAFCRRTVVRTIGYTLGPRISESLRAKLVARRTIARGKT